MIKEIKNLLMYFFLFLLASLLLTEVGNNFGGWSFILAILYTIFILIFRNKIDPIQGKVICLIFTLLIGIISFAKIKYVNFLGIENAWIGIAISGYIFLLTTGFYIKNFWIRIIFRILCLIPLFFMFYVIYLIALSIGPALS